MVTAWAPAGMGKRVHLPPPPSGNVVMCFCPVIVTAKRSDELFIHYFHNLSSAWLLGLRPQTSPGDPSWTPLRDFRPQSTQTPNLPTPGKKSCGCPWVIDSPYWVETTHLPLDLIGITRGRQGARDLGHQSP